MNTWCAPTKFDASPRAAGAPRRDASRLVRAQLPGIRERRHLAAGKNIALELRIEPEKVAEWVAKLLSAGLYNNYEGVFSPHNWDKRQYLIAQKTPSQPKQLRITGIVSVTRHGVTNMTSRHLQSRAEQIQSRAELGKGKSRLSTDGETFQG